MGDLSVAGECYVARVGGECYVARVGIAVVRAALVVLALGLLSCDGLVVAGAQMDPERVPKVPPGVDAQSVTASEVGRDRTLARFDGGRITLGELEDAIANKAPAQRRQLESRPAQVALLQAMIDFDLLAREAERRGYGADPVVRARLARLAVSGLAAELEVAPESIPRERVEARFSEVGAGSFAEAERALRQILAQEQAAQALDRLVEMRRRENPVAIHPELLADIELAAPRFSGIPSGFPASPPDPRAPARLAEADDD